MAPVTRERPGGVWLEGHAHDWVEAGLISSDQAEAIRHFEHLDVPETPRRLVLGAEIASYLAGVIAFAGGIAIVGPNWERLGVIGQVSLGLALALIGFVTGRWLMTLGEAGTDRLAGFLWVVGTGGVALAAAAVMNEIDPRDEAWYPIVIGAIVLPVGLLLWRNRNRPLQMLTAGVGVMLLGAGLIEMTEVSMYLAGASMWIGSFVFGALAAAHRLAPRIEALAMAAAGMMIGSFMFADENERLAAIIAAVTAAGIVGYAMVERSVPLLVIAVFAFFIATTSLMQTVLNGMVARLVAVLVGLAVVGGVAVRAQRLGRDVGAPPHDAPS